MDDAGFDNVDKAGDAPKQESYSDITEGPAEPEFMQTGEHAAAAGQNVSQQKKSDDFVKQSEDPAITANRHVRSGAVVQQINSIQDGTGKSNQENEHKFEPAQKP